MKTQIELLKEFKIAVRGHWGQHLLIDPNIQKKIVELLHPCSGKSVLEIGPGMGALTAWLLDRGVRVTAVEKDPRLCAMLETVFADKIADGFLRLRQADVLKEDLDQLALSMNPPADQIISNLPYYITGPILAGVLPLKRLRRAVFMMQKEVAERIFAKPGSREYGRLSLLVHFFAKAYPAFDVSPKCFTPPPEVHSSVVVFDFKERSKEQEASLEAVLEIAAAAFAQRRKKIMGTLQRDGRWKLSKAEWIGVFESIGICADARPEELAPECYEALERSLRAFRRPHL
ncbi:MAG: ribosomal RNA small subunit methyltransferase A [Candidatus Omnitrophica bacterium]|nr:ribosomal RNA small subunit methyltransferase A [Candidatus Omnitrophota bacterium]